MTIRCRRKVLDAIFSLGDDGVVVTPEDHSKFEALIGDYFNDSNGDCDESGSEDDVESGKRSFIRPSGVVNIPYISGRCP